MNILGNPSRKFSLNLMRIMKVCTEAGAQPCTINKATLTDVRKKRKKKKRIFTQILVSTQEKMSCYFLSCPFPHSWHRIMEEPRGGVPKARFLGNLYRARRKLHDTTGKVL